MWLAHLALQPHGSTESVDRDFFGAVEINVSPGYNR